MGTGQKLYNRAKRVIPGGNMLLSKRPEMFLNKWPSYFSKAKGSEVWDLDGKRFTDLSIMGIGTNILGYGHEEVDSAVAKRVVSTGNMSTLNCPEEVYLAEKLVEMHPWADMVKYARSGGEANALAGIARAASGRDKVAICGYHGWHDWYLAANLNSNGDDALDGHLLPGLEISGVPQNLRGTVYPFHYNDFDELEKLVEEQDIGVIKMGN